jgi:hypothetical protein
MEVETTSSQAYSDHGLIFRKEADDNFYYFGISTDQGFFVSINHKGQWKTLVPYANSPAIHPTGANRLAILAQGTHFVFFINDQYVAELNNNQIESGRIALAIELYNADDQRSYQFDNINLRTPPLPPSPTGTITPTPTNTLTPTLTTTPHLLVTPSNGESSWEDTFDSNVFGWSPYYASNSTVSVRDGKLHLKSDNAGFVELAICIDCPTSRNAFYYQAELVPAETTNLQHGLAFCLSPGKSEYYAFVVDSNQQLYSLYKSRLDKWDILIQDKSSDAINSYPVSNILAVLFDQGNMNFYINGVAVTTFQDEQLFECKQLGIFINGGVAEVVADNIYAYEIIVPPTATSTP